MRIHEIATLTEDMQSLAGLAAYVSPIDRGACVIVIYDPALANPRKPTSGVLGIAKLLDYKPDFWIVSMVMATNGYGPALYAIMADIATDHGALLMQSASVSAAAKKVWKKFEQNPHVEIVPIEDRVGANGNTYNPTPTGIALKGRHTIGLSNATRLDQEVAAELGEEWHRAMIAGSILKLKARMEKL